MKKLYLTLLLLVQFSLWIIAQTDSLATENVIIQDTIVQTVVVQDTVVQESVESKPSKRVSDFKIYGGISANRILLSDSQYESAYSTGFILGLSYKRGKYGYWEIGMNYNGLVVGFEDVLDTQQTLEIRQLDLPLGVGFNLFGETRRVFGLRIFGSLVPGYITSIGENQFNLAKEDFNQFQLGAHAGVGVDVLFLFVEGGYHYGFIDLLNSQDSNLSQLYVLLGFRF